MPRSVLPQEPALLSTKSFCLFMEGKTQENEITLESQGSATLSFWNATPLHLLTTLLSNFVPMFSVQISQFLFLLTRVYTSWLTQFESADSKVQSPVVREPRSFFMQLTILFTIIQPHCSSHTSQTLFTINLGIFTYAATFIFLLFFLLFLIQLITNPGPKLYLTFSKQFP